MMLHLVMIGGAMAAAQATPRVVPTPQPDSREGSVLKPRFTIAQAPIDEMTKPMVEKANTPPDGKAQQAISDMAACTVKAQPEASRATVLAWQTPSFNKSLGKLPLSRCLYAFNTTFSLKGYMLPGMLAEELVRRELSTVSMPDVAKIPAIESRHAPSLDEAGLTPERTDVARTNWVMSVIAECAVRRNPTAAKALILAMPGAEERAAIAGFVPSISACLSPGSQVRFDKTSMRSLTSLSYYRLANAAGILPRNKR